MQTSNARPSPAPLILGGIGAFLLIVGSFMTWVTVSINIDKFAELLGIDPGLISGSGVDTSTTVAGTKGDGKITLVLGLVALVAVIVLVVVATGRKAGAIVLLLAGLAGALLCLWEVTTKDSQINDALNQSGDVLSQIGVTADAFKEVFTVAWGIGLWTCLVGGILAAIGGIMALVSKPAVAPVAVEGTSAPMGTGFEVPPASTAPLASEPPAPTPATEPPPVSTEAAPEMPEAAPEMPEAAPEMPEAAPEMPEAPGEGPGGTTA